MSREETVALVKSHAKFCATYVTFSSPNFLFFIFARLLIYESFLRALFLRNFFKPGALTIKKTLEWSMNERFETRMGCCKIFLADINKFLSSLCNYKSSNQNDIRRKTIYRYLGITKEHPCILNP